MPGLLDKVFIIESVGASDLFYKTSEGEGLQSMLHLARVSSAIQRPTNQRQFIEAINIFKASGAQALHISCHGNAGGISFTDGSSMAWNDLHAVIAGREAPKFLCLSSCEALAGTELVECFATGSGRRPVIIGSPNVVDWNDAILFWGMIYYALTREIDDSYVAVTRALASIALSRRCEFQLALYTTNGTGAGMDYKTMSAHECLDEICEIYYKTANDN